MRPRLLDKLTQVSNEVFIVERKGKSFFAAAATPNRQAQCPRPFLLLYNRHAGLKQFVINFRVGKKKLK